MTFESTARHAINLFTLTMESRYGSDWRRRCRGETIAAMATEVASGFGGVTETPVPARPDSAVPVRWRFPDASTVLTGAFGVMVEASAAA